MILFLCSQDRRPMTLLCLIVSGDTEGTAPDSELAEMKHDDILGETVQEEEAISARQAVMKLVWDRDADVLSCNLSLMTLAQVNHKSLAECTGSNGWSGYISTRGELC